MRKSLAVLSIFSVMSVSATAQTAPAANPAQPAKPQMIKKRVCEKVEDDNPYSRLGSRTVCRTVQVPADQAAGNAANGQQPQSPSGATNNNM
jgi:hypothetical protein